MKYLLDRFVISELVTPHQNKKEVMWLQEKIERGLAINTTNGLMQNKYSLELAAKGITLENLFSKD